MKIPYEIPLDFVTSSALNEPPRCRQRAARQLGELAAHQLHEVVELCGTDLPHVFFPSELVVGRFQFSWRYHQVNLDIHGKIMTVINSNSW